MIICRFTHSGQEEQFDTIDQAIEALEEEEISCCDDDELAENIFSVKCDLLQARDSGETNYGFWAELDDDWNWVFER